MRSLSRSAATSSRRILHWTASSGGPTSYSIYRGTQSDGEATTPVATVSGTTTTYTDTGLMNASSYYYMVAAINATGVSPDSNEVIAAPGVSLPSGTNLALNQPTYASSIQGAGYPAKAATDDNFNTRWSSAASDRQWLLVDLGRYLRMYGTVRGTGYGYSLWEFQVFGT